MNKKLLQLTKPIGFVEEQLLCQYIDLTDYRVAIDYFNTRKYECGKNIFKHLHDELQKLANIANIHNQSLASAHAMLFNYWCCEIRKRIKPNRNNNRLEYFLNKAASSLSNSLDYEPCWAEYVDRYIEISQLIHSMFGCVIKKEGEQWHIKCSEIAKKLGASGMSIGFIAKYTCSICNKDPINCTHQIGKIYDGRYAVNVAQDLEIDHISLVENPANPYSYILPRPLTKDDLYMLFDKETANKIIKGKIELRCKHLPLERLKLRKNQFNLNQ